MADKDKVSGFVKMHRQMVDWEWYTDVVVKTVFIHCIFRANYKDTEWRGIKIKRGQFITSYANLAEECGITVSQARRAISALCSTGEITHKPHARFSMITVLKYNLYQTDNKVNNKENNKLATSSQQQIKNNKNNKKYKEYIEEPESEDEDDDEDGWFVPYQDENGKWIVAGEES